MGCAQSCRSKKIPRMPESPSCLNAKASLDEIRLLRQAFDEAYDAAVIAKSPSDRTHLLATKESLSTAIDLLQEKTYPVEIERAFHLREQHEFQKNLLVTAGILELRVDTSIPDQPREILFIKGIDGKEYPLPSVKDIQKSMCEKRSLLQIKADQAFNKLLLVPFGMSLDDIIARFKSYLLRKRRYVTLDLSGRINSVSPISSLRGLFDDADRSGKLVYEPRLLETGGYGGKTKQEILDEQTSVNKTCAGWRILLIQTSDDVSIRPIPDAGKEQTIGIIQPRIDIPTTGRPDEYIHALKQDRSDRSPYEGEYGMTPEEWMIACITQWETVGRALDMKGTMKQNEACLTGSYIHGENMVPTAGWDRIDRRASLSAEGHATHSQKLGIRTAVRL